MIKNDGSKKRVVKFREYRPSLGPLMKRRPASLEVDDSCIPILDEIVMTFIYCEKLRKERERQSRNAAASGGGWVGVVQKVKVSIWVFQNDWYLDSWLVVLNQARNPPIDILYCFLLVITTRMQLSRYGLVIYEQHFDTTRLSKLIISLRLSFQIPSTQPFYALSAPVMMASSVLVG